MKWFTVKVYKVAGEVEVKIQAEDADAAARLVTDQAADLKFDESKADVLAMVVA